MDCFAYLWDEKNILTDQVEKIGRWQLDGLAIGFVAQIFIISRKW